MASSKIQKRFDALEQRVADLEALLAEAMADDDDAVTPPPSDSATKPNSVTPPGV